MIRKFVNVGVVLDFLQTSIIDNSQIWGLVEYESRKKIGVPG